MFIYQKSKRYYAQVSTGLESIVAKELQALGAHNVVPGFRGMYFSADSEVLYTVNYKSRLISHVLAPLASFECQNREDLYRNGKSVDWSRIFSLDNTFAIVANVSSNEHLRHSKFAALCLKDAVADHFRSKFGRRPDVDASGADVWINLHIQGKNATVSLDTSGGSLHRRGYRIETVDAPMQETLAAALVEVSGWHGEKPFYDPMCGSGTILCEAMMKACKVPAGFFRKKFGFFFLPDFNKNLWKKIKQNEDNNIEKLPCALIAGSDLDPIAVKAAKTNCKMLPGGDRIQITQNDFTDVPRLENMMIVCNPPYGIRLKKGHHLGSFYKTFGDFLKQRCKGSQAIIYFGNREMIKHIGLKPSWKKPMRNAALDGRAVKYELF
ncbi:MAG: class I SAM-dependent RNA methyltransferase [Desulfobacterales bacterium]